MELPSVTSKENVEKGLLEVIARLSNNEDFKVFTDYIIKSHVDLSVASTKKTGIEGHCMQGACQMLEVLLDDIMTAPDLLKKVIADKRQKRNFVASFGNNKPARTV